MESGVCEQCGEVFWLSEPDQGICVTCKERPSEEANRERAAEQYAKYIAKLRAQGK